VISRLREHANDQ